MPLPPREQQRDYARLSNKLAEIVERYRRELPKGTASVSLTCGNKMVLEACDGLGRIIGKIPNEATSGIFRMALQPFTMEKFSETVTITVPDVVKVRGL
jgi:hypothetical protein